MLRSLLAIALFLVLAVPGTSQAINICGSNADTCVPLEVVSGTTGVSLQLWFNTEGTTALSFAGSVTANGATAFTAAANGSIMPPGGCSTAPSFPGTFGFACGTGATIIPGSAQFATLTFDAGAVGDNIVLSSGSYFSAYYSEPNVENVGSVLVSIVPVPDPGAVVLLGAGLAGLAFLRRKRA